MEQEIKPEMPKGNKLDSIRHKDKRKIEFAKLKKQKNKVSFVVIFDLMKNQT